MPKPINLTAFLGNENTLQKWDARGSFVRELKQYRHFQEQGVNVSLVSFGGREELDYASQAPGIRILCNRFGLPLATYVGRIHQIHARAFLRADVLRTHQTAGILAAMKANWAWQAPMVARMDYDWARNLRINQPENSVEHDHVEGQLRMALQRADHVIVTTEELASAMTARVPAAAAKLTVIPNFVDTDSFRPAKSEKRFDLVFVGRLARIKNLDALYEALSRLDRSLAVISGSISRGREGASASARAEELRKRYGDLHQRVHWIGRVPYDEVPAWLNQARAFILCSLSEGHPRAMVEAMACGMPVIGTNVAGIGSLLKHEETGYLCDTNAESIARAIETVLSNPALMRKMGANAREFVLERYASTEIARREYDLLRKVVAENPVAGAPKRLAQYVLRRNPAWS